MNVAWRAPLADVWAAALVVAVVVGVVLRSIGAAYQLGSGIVRFLGPLALLALLSWLLASQ